MAVFRMTLAVAGSFLLASLSLAQSPVSTATSTPVPAARGPTLKAALDAAHVALKTCRRPACDGA
jgi:hypothetical protein